jgi:hypothetical protein
MRRTIALASLVCTAAAAANATTLQAHFDLRAHPGQAEWGLQSGFDLTDNGLTATFTGRYFNPANIVDNEIAAGSVVGDGYIGRYSSGAGVTNALTDNSHQVDGSGFKDFIQISFDYPASITQIHLTYFDAYDVEKELDWSWNCWCWYVSDYNIVDDDDFRWMVDTSGDGAIGIGDWVSDNENPNPFSGFGGETSLVWGFGAFEHNDDWKLKKVSVEYEMAPIPLPASVFLLLGAVGGLGYMGRRKKA